MYYVSTVSYNTTDENGKDKNVKEKIILENCETFTEAEKRSYDEYKGSENFDVTDIKRYPKLREFVNNCGDGEKIILQQLQAMFHLSQKAEKKSKPIIM